MTKFLFGNPSLKLSKLKHEQVLFWLCSNVIQSNIILFCFLSKIISHCSHTQTPAPNLHGIDSKARQNSCYSNCAMSSLLCFSRAKFPSAIWVYRALAIHASTPSFTLNCLGHVWPVTQMWNKRRRIYVYRLNRLNTAIEKRNTWNPDTCECSFSITMGCWTILHQVEPILTSLTKVNTFFLWLQYKSPRIWSAFCWALVEEVETRHISWKRMINKW